MAGPGGQLSERGKTCPLSSIRHARRQAAMGDTALPTLCPGNQHHKSSLLRPRLSPPARHLDNGRCPPEAAKSKRIEANPHRGVHDYRSGDSLSFLHPWMLSTKNSLRRPYCSAMIFRTVTKSAMSTFSSSFKSAATVYSPIAMMFSTVTASAMSTLPSPFRSPCREVFSVK